MVERLQGEDARTSLQGWKEFAKASVLRGGKAAHAFSKKQV